MPTYLYQAKDGSGQTISGEITAEDERMAAGRVRELGYYPMRVQRGAAQASQAAPSQGAAGVAQTGAGYAPPTATADTYRSDAYRIFDPTTGLSPRPGQVFSNGEPAIAYGSWFERTFVFPIWTGVSPKDLALFYRQFSALLGAGMSMARSLTTIQDQTNGPLRRAVWHMNRHIQAGGKLSEAMAIFPHIFNSLQRSIIATSEETGALDVMMIRISEYIEADFALRQMIRRETFMPKINFAATFLLPTLVVAVTQGAGAYFHTAVMPLLEIVGAMFAIYLAGRFALADRNVMVPGMTAPMLNPLAVGYDTVKAYLPYFGTTVRMLALAKFSRAFASLYAGGVLIPRAVLTSSRVTGNKYIDSMMRKAVDHMMAGESLTDSFARTGIFPQMFISMLGTGEMTGNLDGMLNKVAEFYESESAIRLHQSVTVLNTLIFLIVACIVGYEVIHFWSGYYNGVMGAGG
jgi:type II secretory pathway component PulF